MKAPKTLSKTPSAKTKQLGYHAVDSTATTRVKSSSVVKSEDLLLTSEARKRLIETARDSYRNFSVVRFAVEKHLDYTARFGFRARTGNRDFDRRLEKAVAKWSLAPNCDIARRNSLSDLIRMQALGSILDGDAALLLVKGGKLQAFSGERIAKAANSPDTVNRHGLILDPFGAAVKYSLCYREPETNILKMGTLADADNVALRAYFTGMDQVRGISPLACILNQAADLYESLNYTLLKTKLQSLFGLVIYRETKSGQGEFQYDVKRGDGLPATTEQEDYSKDRYDVQLRPGLKLEMKPGDRMDLLESKNPSSEFQNFTLLECRLILAALGMPLSALNSDSASWSGMKGDWSQYMARASVEQEKTKATLYQITDWRLPLLLARGEAGPLPAGMAPEHVVASYDWYPTGSSMLDNSKEAATDVLEIQSGLTSRQRACQKRGVDFFDIVDEQKQEMDYAKANQVDLATVPMNIRVATDQQEPQPQGKNQ